MFRTGEIERKRRGTAPLAAALAVAIGLSYGGPLRADEHEAHGTYEPDMSAGAKRVEHDPDVFGPDPTYEDKPYDMQRQLDIYGGKSEIDEPRPVFEAGRRLYTEGPFQPGGDLFGKKNLSFGALSLYGDLRTAIAFNDNGQKETGLFAARLNLDVDLRFTATERLHGFFRPLDTNGQFTRCEFFGDDQNGCDPEFDGNIEALFFEGDAGAILAGITGEYNSIDLPFVAGKFPLFLQNGVWAEDALSGIAVALPALNSATFDISNMDITFFAAFDSVTSPAFKDRGGEKDDGDIFLYGATAFIDAMGGYWELGYGYIDGRDTFDQFDYHNFTAAFTRRYGGWLSNSIRVIANVGQDRGSGRDQTANGAILLIENSLITSKPLTLVPYFNFFFGFDRPQALVKAADGVLKNTGINFETDGLTGFPKLDDTGHDTWGGAIGIEYLFDLDRQIIVEFATVQVLGPDNADGRPAKGAEYAWGVRFQQPLTRAWLLRADAMYGLRTEDDDLLGARIELRRKF